MKRVAATLGFVVVFSIVGCFGNAMDRDEPDYHILKLGRPYTGVIADPYKWALEQLSDGPISGPDVDNYTRQTLRYGLEEARADLGSDGTQELLLRPANSARLRLVLVLTPVDGGYRFLGSFGARQVVALDTPEPSVRVYEPCGGHFGYIATYRHDGSAFVSVDREGISAGDGYPEENNRRLAELFPADKTAKWEKVAEGANVNAKNKDGQTPLHRAARSGRTEVAKELIAKGGRR